MKKSEIAEKYFKSGYNCSQSVAMAFSSEIGMMPDEVARLTIGFGGGMGRMREICGAVSGMTFVISALYGDKSKGDVYSMVQDAAKEFEKENGSIICRELLSLSDKKTDSPNPEPRTKEYYKKRPCAELVHIAADILEAFINKQYQTD